MRVVVLGAGFGGLELAARLSGEFGDTGDVVLIDRNDGFVFGFSKLELMFGRAQPSAVRHRYDDLVKPGVRFVQSTVRSIDPGAKRVDTGAGTFDADILVVALGSDVDPSATPGLVEGGHEFYTVEGALAVRDALAGFAGGRVLIGVTSQPFKCTPAPSEAALLLDDHLTERGLRDRSDICLAMPMKVPVPPSPPASDALVAAFTDRHIDWRPERAVHALDPDSKVARLSDGSELAFDLYLGVPVHRVPRVVEEAGLTENGWVPVDPLTLETRFPGVFAVGDVTSVGGPKAGTFAEAQATVVADRIGARMRGEEASAQYEGRGACYVEFGHDTVGRIDVTVGSGGKPSGVLQGPSPELAAEKATFSTDRVRRWFAP